MTLYVLWSVISECKRTHHALMDYLAMGTAILAALLSDVLTALNLTIIRFLI